MKQPKTPFVSPHIRHTLRDGFSRVVQTAAAAAVVCASGALAQVTDLGEALAGTTGEPHLTIQSSTGSLVGGATIDIKLSNALPSGAASLMIGFTRADTPIFGGTLVPSPDLPVSVLIDGNGNASTQITWPSDLVQPLYMQFVVIDAGGPEGVALSNAVQMQTLQPGTTLSIATANDLGNAVGKVPYRIVTATGTETALSSEDGLGDAFTLASSQTVLATVGEKRFADGGLLLGQSFPVNLPDNDPYVSHHAVIHKRYQPYARPFEIRNNSVTVTPEPDHVRWRVISIEDFAGQPGPSPFSFTADCGILLTPEEIVAFEFFNQSYLPPNDYQLAFNMRVEDTTGSFGMNDVNFVVEMDCAGHEFVGAPDATPVLLYEASVGAGSGSLNTSVIHWDAATELALVWVRGSMNKGDNLILLSQSPAVTGFASIMKQPVLVASGGNGGPGMMLAGGGTDCNPSSPPEPNFPNECIPPAPSSAPCCPPEKKIGNRTCEEWSEFLFRHCTGGASSGGSVTITKEESGGVAVSVSTPGVSVEQTGGVSGTTSSNFPIEHTNGGGCGQCTSFYEPRQKCKQKYRYWVWVAKAGWDDLPFLYFDCDYYDYVSECEQSGGITSSAPCDRTNCD